jgi:hypothetical protein
MMKLFHFVYEKRLKDWTLNISYTVFQMLQEELEIGNSFFMSYAVCTPVLVKSSCKDCSQLSVATQIKLLILKKN